MTRYVEVQEMLRDAETNEIIGSNRGFGTTEDEGVTVVIPNGYVPMIETTPAEDITVTLLPVPITKVPSSLVSRVNDAEANTSTLVFTFPEA